METARENGKESSAMLFQTEVIVSDRGNGAQN